MADEEVRGSASPAPSDHKRKLDDLDSEPFEQPPVSAESNGNSETVADADGDAAPTGVSPEDPDVKRPRLDDNADGFGMISVHVVVGLMLMVVYMAWIMSLWLHTYEAC